MTTEGNSKETDKHKSKRKVTIFSLSDICKVKMREKGSIDRQGQDMLCGCGEGGGVGGGGGYENVLIKLL